MDSFLVSFDKYIERFHKSLPSEITEAEILVLEKLINDLYLDMIEKQYPQDLEDAVIDALGLTSALVDEINRNKNQNRSPEFFKTIKRLANLLKLIQYYAK
jgi:hypothetical protein